MFKGLYLSRDGFDAMGVCLVPEFCIDEAREWSIPDFNKSVLDVLYIYALSSASTRHFLLATGPARVPTI